MNLAMADKKKPDHASGILSFFSPKSNVPESGKDKRKSRPSPGTDSSPEDLDPKRGRINDGDGQELSDIRESLDYAVNIDELMSHIDKKMAKCLETFKSETEHQIKSYIMGLAERIDKLEARVEKYEKSKCAPCNCAEEIVNIKRELNRQAQYSRKDSIRIFGVSEKPQEECKAVVCNMLNEKLGIRIGPNDIAASHRLPSRNPDKPKPIIVRLRDRALKEAIINERKRLRGKGVSINEDMTVDNVKLINRAQNSGIFDSVWFWNGKVHAKDKRGRHHILDLFQNFGEG